MLAYLLAIATQKSYLIFIHSCDHSSTVFGPISRSHCHISSLFLFSNLHLRPVVSTQQFVMTFFPDEFEQKDKVHVMKLKAPDTKKSSII